MNDSNSSRRRFLDRARTIAVKHFETSAHKYDTVFPTIDPIHLECVEEFLRRLGPKPAILDAACGTGRLFDTLSPRAGRLIGVDQSGSMLDQARAKKPDVETRLVSLQDLCEITAFREAFDGLLCVDAMEWIMRDDWPAVLAGFRSVLTATGHAYLTIETPGEKEALALRSPTVDGAVCGEIPVHYWYNHFPSRDSVMEWISNAGFDLVFEAHGKYYWHIILRKRN